MRHGLRPTGIVDRETLDALNVPASAILRKLRTNLTRIQSLAAPTKGRYVFVNRRGMKVAERSRRGLAVELKRKSLTILAESQVFDRALQAVIGNLRQMHRSGPATS